MLETAFTVKGSVYTGTDPFGTGTKLVRKSLVFARDLADPVRIGSAIWYQMGPLMKVILRGTVLEPVLCIQSGSDPKGI